MEGALQVLPRDMLAEGVDICKRVREWSVGAAGAAGPEDLEKLDRRTRLRAFMVEVLVGSDVLRVYQELLYTMVTAAADPTHPRMDLEEKVVQGVGVKEPPTAHKVRTQLVMAVAAGVHGCHTMYTQIPRVLVTKA